MYDLGDVVPLSVEVRDASGVLANAGAVTCTVTLPTGTTVVVSVANTGTGKYAATYSPSVTGRFSVRWVATGANASAYTDTFEIADPGDLALVSLDALKTHLNITGSSSDEELRSTLLAATSAAEGHINRPLRRGSRSQTFTMPKGNGCVLALQDTDLASIDSITEDGDTLTADDWRAELSPGVVWRYPIGAAWSMPTTVTYTVQGIDTPALRQAVLELARHLWETQRGTMPMMPRDPDAFAPTGTAYSLPNRVMELLAPYRMPL